MAYILILNLFVDKLLQNLIIQVLTFFFIKSNVFNNILYFKTFIIKI